MKDFFLKSFQEYKKRTKCFWNISPKNGYEFAFPLPDTQKEFLFLYYFLWEDRIPA